MVDMDDLFRTVDNHPSLEGVTFTVHNKDQLSIVVNAAEFAKCNYTVLEDPERKGVCMVFVKGDPTQLKECVRIVSRLRA